MPPIQLGHTYHDKITRFRGVATGHCEYITGCNQTLIQPVGAGPDGATRNEPQWFDDQRLELMDGVAPVVLDNAETPGFDKPAPKR